MIVLRPWPTTGPATQYDVFIEGNSHTFNMHTSVTNACDDAYQRMGQTNTQWVVYRTLQPHCFYLTEAVVPLPETFSDFLTEWFRGTRQEVYHFLVGCMRMETTL